MLYYVRCKQLLSSTSSMTRKKSYSFNVLLLYVANRSAIAERPRCKVG